MRSIELFTGGGGLALGTHRAGFQHAALMEWNEDACRTLQSNIVRSHAGLIRSMPSIAHWNVHHADIREMLKAGFFNAYEHGELDLLAGGVPCQPFSVGGKHRAFSDARDLFPDFVSVVRKVRPRAFIVENVKGLLRQSFCSYFQYILLQLTYPDITARPSEDWRDHLRRLEEVKTSGARGDLSYNVVFELLNAADYGVPQTRERVFIVGFRADLGVDWHFPAATHSREALVYEQFVTEEYWARHNVKRPTAMPIWTSGASTSALARRKRPTTQPWRTIRDALKGLPAATTSGDLFSLNHILKEGARVYPGHSGSPVDLPAKTLKAGVHGVPGGENMMIKQDGTPQYFTVREAARIQSFPDDWVFEGAWSEAMRQLGNAVPVKLAEIVASSVHSALSKTARSPQ